MSSHEDYNPGPAQSSQVRGEDGDRWTLVLTRDLRHSPEVVWEALTDPDQLQEWAPFDADRNLGSVGRVTLTTAGNRPHVSETQVTRAEAPKVLEFQWGGNETRWELEPVGDGTRLTLWAKIDRRFIAMGAAGWHVCLDVLERLLAGAPMGRLVAEDALKSPAWQRLNREYSEQFGVEPVSW